jgi:hypothetical protein
MQQMLAISAGRTDATGTYLRVKSHAFKVFGMRECVTSFNLDEKNMTFPSRRKKEEEPIFKKVGFQQGRLIPHCKQYQYNY